MTATDCPDCKAAAERPHWVFSGGCRGCCARSIARLPGFHEARRAKDTRHARYRRELAEVGANVKPPVTHNEVMQAFAADAAQRRTTATT